MFALERTQILAPGTVIKYYFKVYDASLGIVVSFIKIPLKIESYVLLYDVGISFML